MIFDNREKKMEMDGGGIQSCEFTIVPAIFLRLWYAVKAVFHRHSMGGVSGKRSSIAILSLFFFRGKTMRRPLFYTLFYILLAAIVFFSTEKAAAKSVTKENVLTAAKTFLVSRYPAVDSNSARTMTAKGQSSLKAAEISELTTSNKLVGYIINLEPAGFILFSSDDEAPPVKIYSDSGSYEQLPEGLRKVLELELLEDNTVITSSNNQNSQLQSSGFSQQWNYLTDDQVKEPEETFLISSPGVALIQTHWDQDDPYNYYCPLAGGGSGGRAYTGCSATAFAQILRYHKKPAAVAANYTYTDNQGSCQGTHSLSDAGMEPYDWSNMPTSINGSSNETQKRAVGQLIYHCGVVLESDYEADGTGAYAYMVPFALEAYFYYTSDDYVGRYEYSDSEWYNKIKSDIDTIRPIYYTMRTADGISGHAVVCDGYRNGNEIHLELGWSGVSTAWYNMNSVSAGGYTWINHGGIFKITPPMYAPATINYPSENTIGQYTVSWSSTGATSYQLERSDNGGSSWSQVYSDSNTSYQEKIVDGSYRYRVEAIYPYGSSGWTTGNWDCDVSTIAGPELINYPSSSGNGQFSVSWSTVSDVNGYQLERSYNGGSTWSEVYRGANTSCSQKIKANGSYRYRVKAKSGASLSGWKTGGWDCAVAIESPYAGCLTGWGENSDGECDVPDGNNFTGIAAGTWHSLALQSDGALTAWGYNDWEQCDVPDGNNFAAVSAGFLYSVALKLDGSLVAWGRNSYGLLNPPSGNNYIAIAACGEHGLALKSDGSVVAWGANYSGQCNAPTEGTYTAIAAGTWHSLSLKSDGTLAAWGRNYDGQCDVPNGNNYTAIAAGYNHSLAMKSDGRLIAWGDNSYGQCDVPDGNNFISIAAGYEYSLALKSDGTLIAWGGDNSYGERNVPAYKNYTSIAAGGYHNLAITRRSISGDLDGNGQIDFRDYAIFGAAWESQPGQQNWNPACEMSEPKDNIVNLPDLAEFSVNWLVGIE